MIRIMNVMNLLMRTSKRFAASVAASTLTVFTSTPIFAQTPQAGITESRTCHALFSNVANASSASRPRQKAAKALQLLVAFVGKKPASAAFSPFGVSQVLGALEVGADEAMKAAIDKLLGTIRDREGSTIEIIRQEGHLVSATASNGTGHDRCSRPGTSQTPVAPRR